MATVQLRNPTEGRDYHDRRKADGKTSMESMRALKHRLYAVAHTISDRRTGPGGHRGKVSVSSAAGSHPHTNSSEKSLPGPATTNPRTPLPTAS